MQAQLSVHASAPQAKTIWEQINSDVIELHSRTGWNKIASEALAISKLEFGDKRDQFKKVFDHGISPNAIP